MDKKQSKLVAGLKKLLSTNVTVINIGKKKLKVMDTDSLKLRDSYGLLGDYSSIRNTIQYGKNSYSSWSSQTGYGFNAQRRKLYNDYENMEQDPIISSALDVYADESTLKNETGDILNIYSEDNDIKEILENLFYDILNVNFNLWSWIRNMCKYGDAFIFLQLHEEVGVIGFTPLTPYVVERQEEEQGAGKHSIHFIVDGFSTNQIENYQIGHFRLLNDTNYMPYGKSIIEQARRTWKQLNLLEDAMLIHRITRAPEKRVIKIDVGNIPPAQVDTYMRKVIDKMKRTPYIDPDTGEYNLRYNIENINEDIYLPIRGNAQNTSIDTLGELSFTATDDLEYLRCLRGDTNIRLLNGEDIPIKDVVERIKNEDLYTLSINPENLEMVPTKIINAKKTIKDAKLVRVTLDNGEHIDCTPDHRFMLRDGTYKEAQYLKVDENLMSLKQIYKVKSIEFLNETEDTYDIEVSKYSNFALSSGIFVHNSKLHAALKVPKSWLGYEEDISGKATLASEDLRFARTIERVQQIVVSELTKIAITHLYIQGYKDKDLLNFDIEMTSPSVIYEQQKVELLDQKIRLAESMLGDLGMFSKEKLYKEIFNMSDVDIEEEKKKVFSDAKEYYRLYEIKNNGNDPQEAENEEEDEKEETYEWPETEDAEEEHEVDMGSEKKPHSPLVPKDDSEENTKLQTSDLKDKFTGGSPLAIDKD